jgi:hypothetical protein
MAMKMERGTVKITPVRIKLRTVEAFEAAAWSAGFRRVRRVDRTQDNNTHPQMK